MTSFTAPSAPCALPEGTGPRAPGLRSLLLVVAAGLSLAACRGDSLKPPAEPDDRTLFWGLELNHHAVTLGLPGSGYDTLQLVAMPRNRFGEPLTGLPPVQYTPRDPERVAVTSDGQLVARASTGFGAAWVVASVTTNNLKHEDSVWVKVMAADQRPELATFSIHPVPPDTAKAAALQIGGPLAQENFASTLPLRMADPAGVSLLAGRLPVYLRSSDPSVATPGTVYSQDVKREALATTSERGLTFFGRRPGSVTFYAEATVFGARKADTLSYRIGWPLFGEVNVGPTAQGYPPGTFLQPAVTIATGGIVRWTMPTLVRSGGTLADSVLVVDVTFADGTVANVAAFGPSSPYYDLLGGFCFFPVADCNAGSFELGPGIDFDSSEPLTALRTFTEPGIYEYRSTINGTRGRIVVVDDES
jgi:hypothetical protein